MNRSFVFALAITLIAACSTKEMEFQTPVQEDVVFYASFEQPSDINTRVYANEDLLLRWTADDRVSIFNKNTYNQQYAFTGETGDNAGGFRKVESDEFMTGNAISNVVSVYPYQTTTKIAENESISVTLPAVQHYAKNTFGLGANTMVSVSEDNFLQYKNVGGYLMIKLYGEGISVSSITLKGNNGEKLAGNATVSMPLDGVPTVVMASDAMTEITLTSETPIQLGATEDESTQFWFVVPPITFSQGFTITVKDSSSKICHKSTSKSVVIERNKVSKMSPMEVVPVINPQKYLTFTPGTSFESASVSLTNYKDNAPVLYYSTNKIDWLLWDYSDLVVSDELYICGDNPDGFSLTNDQYSTFTVRGGNICVFGDIMSLIDSEHDLTTIPCEFCFTNLFLNCSSLISAPDLPATTLTEGCYSKMFYGCSELTNAPELPATTLVPFCYESMFWGCSRLEYVKCLATSISAMGCVDSWLTNVGVDGTFFRATNMNDWPRGVNGIPYSWKNQTYMNPSKYLTFTSMGYTRIALENRGDNSPVLYYSTDKEVWTHWDNYHDISFTSSQPLYVIGDNPEGLSSSTSDYSIFTATGAKFSVSGDIMSLIDSEHDLTAIPCDFCFRNLFANCSILISAPDLPATTLTEGCYVGLFYGCTSLTTAPDLPATTLSEGCYAGLFYGCTSLTTAPDLPATTLSEGCYALMFLDCKGLRTAPALPATTLAKECYSSMFSGCSSLTTAPDLLATTLADICYESMFSGCTELNYIKCLATDISAYRCVVGWLNGVANTGTFIKAPEMNDWQRGSSGIPEGWEILDAE